MTGTGIDEWFRRCNDPLVTTVALWLARDIPAAERHSKVVALEGLASAPHYRTLHIDVTSRGGPPPGSGIPALAPSETQRVLVMVVATGAIAPDGGDACEIARGFLDVTTGAPGSFAAQFGGVPARAAQSRARLVLGATTARVEFGGKELTLAP